MRHSNPDGDPGDGFFVCDDETHGDHEPLSASEAFARWHYAWQHYKKGMQGIYDAIDAVAFVDPADCGTILKAATKLMHVIETTTFGKIGLEVQGKMRAKFDLQRKAMEAMFAGTMPEMGTEN